MVTPMRGCADGPVAKGVPEPVKAAGSRCIQSCRGRARLREALVGFLAETRGCSGDRQYPDHAWRADEYLYCRRLLLRPGMG